jgi:hypothetical protein
VQENFCKVRGLVHFSAKQLALIEKRLTENMDLSPSCQDFAILLLECVAHEMCRFSIR